jgi:small conductance mechanosensitive channel
MHSMLQPALWALRTGIFAEGRFLGRMMDAWAVDGEDFVRAKLPHLLMVALIAFILNRLLHLITNRMISLAEQHAPEHNRIAQVRTMAGVIRTTGLAVIGAIVGLQFLAAVGVNLAPLLTSAGIAGVAIGLAAQNIVRDMFNGILILIEDQFNVGDTVRVAGVTGTVEAMTLRKTTVRDIEGTLYIIPNSQIATVANFSVGYSLATIPVSVDFSANPDAVRELLAAIALEVRNSAEFSPDFAADPQVLGVDVLKGSEMIFPVIFKTLATRQYAPVREFKRRVRLALEQHHLLPGDPQRVFAGFGEQSTVGAKGTAAPVAPAHDPTVYKPQSGHPFAGE